MRQYLLLASLRSERKRRSVCFQLGLQGVRKADKRLQSHHRLSIFVFLKPETEAEWDHELYKTGEDGSFPWFNDISIDL